MKKSKQKLILPIVFLFAVNPWFSDSAFAERIAFVSDRDGNEEIYLMNVDGSNQIRLTNDPGVDASPVFSPDGGNIAFISNRSGSHRIYTMLWNGGELHEVPNSECFLGYTNYCRSLAWSPDGQKLLFEPTYDSLATINLDGSGKTILLTGGVDGHDVIWGPEWGPTMDDIYFNAQVFHWGYDQHIFHYSISGNNWTQITLDVQPMLSAGPKVSRWTSQIVFFRQQGWQGPENIFTMDLDGSNESQITFDEDATLKNRTPDWCGETGEIVFWSNKSGVAQVWLMDSTGGNLRMLEGEGNNYAPSWTPAPVIEAAVDINPNVLNLKSRGRWITCYIWLAEEYDVADVDPDTLLLNDQVGAAWSWIDEAEQMLMAKFPRSQVQDIIEPGEVGLTVTGELLDGTKFEGSDTIRVIDKGEKKSTATIFGQGIGFVKKTQRVNKNKRKYVFLPLLSQG